MLGIAVLGIVCIHYCQVPSVQVFMCKPLKLGGGMHTHCPGGTVYVCKSVLFMGMATIYRMYGKRMCMLMKTNRLNGKY